MLVLLMAFTTQISFGANLSGIYYIDAISGLDSNTGQSEVQAWKTFDNVNKSVLLAGTKILLKKGSVWNQRLEIRGSGTRENWIVVSNYGDGEVKPKISLTNNKNDIGILICDLDKTSGTVKTQNISFIEIKDIEIANTRLGIYYRSIKTTQNTGFNVKNVTFNNINCDEVMFACNAGTDLAVKNAEITSQLAAIKGNLFDQNGNADGGKYEYIFPAAIFVGGKTLTNQTITGTHTTVLTEFKVLDCDFNECIAGVMSVFYWPINSGTGANAWRQIVHKVSVKNCTGTGAVNGMIAFDGINGGAVPNAEGVMQPDANGWGVLQKVSVKMGSTVPGRTWPNGTTGLIFSNVQNFLVDSCEFSDVINQNNPDGCGFDFETNTNQVTVQNTKFINNDGHAMLMMNGGGFGGNTNIIIQNNLFAKNIKNSNSEFDLYFSLGTDGHQNIKVRNNIAFMRKTNKMGNPVKFNNNNRLYISAIDNDVYYLDDTAQPITVSFLGEAFTYNATVSAVSIPIISSIYVQDNNLFTDKKEIGLKSKITKSAAAYYQASEDISFSGAQWLLYNSEIPFTLTSGSGNKTVYLKVKNVIGESNAAKFNILYKEAPEKLDASTRQHINVSPNPVVSFTKITVMDLNPEGKEQAADTKTVDYLLTILDLNGRILKQYNMNENNYVVDFTDLLPGTYLINLKGKMKNYSNKIVKN